MDRHYGLAPEPLSEEARRILTGGRDEMIKHATAQDKWARSNCPICGREYPHKVDYMPVTCGRFDCLQEANKRGLLEGV